jgi:iron complex transport system substrate-binding protein
MCLRAGGDNIYADSPVEYPEVDPEWVIEQQPDIIVKAVGNEVIPSGSGYGITDASPLKAKRDEIMNPDIRPGWDTIPAIKEGKVYLMTTDIYTGPRATIGVLYMAKWFHPVEFSDIDPAKVHQEWLQKFHGIDPELTGSFIFAYPEFD